MVGGLDTQEEVVVEEKKSGLSGLLASRNGRIIVAAVALVLVLLAAGAVVYLFLFAGSPDEFTTPPPSGTGVTTGTADSTVTVPVLRKTKPLSSTFVFRDIFHPTVKATFEDTATTGGTGTGGTGTGTGGTGTGTGTGTGGTGTSDVEELVLKSVTTQDGVEVATFELNGQTYTLAEGEEISGTPWQVVSIDGQTVTLLYGDTRIVLTVGERVETSTSGGTTTK